MNEIDYEDFYPALLIPDAELVFNTALDLMEDHFNEDSPRTTAVMTLTNEELVGQPPALVIILGESIKIQIRYALGIQTLEKKQSVCLSIKNTEVPGKVVYLKKKNTAVLLRQMMVKFYLFLVSLNLVMRLFV